MLKKLSACLLVLVILFLPTGCWDRRELEDLAYIVALGVDIPEGGNQEDRSITVRVVVPGKLAGGGGSGGGGDAGKAYYDLTVRADSIFGAIALAQTAISRKLSLLQCRFIFVGERLARVGVRPLTGVVARYTELRRDVLLGVVRGSVEEYMKKDKSILDLNIVRYYDELAAANEFTGYTTTSTYHSFAEGVETPGGDPILMLCAVNSEGLEQYNPDPIAGEVNRRGARASDYVGVAVFDGDKMTGELGLEETRIVNMIRGDYSTGEMSIEDPIQQGQRIGFRLRAYEKPEIKADISHTPVRVNVRIKLAAQLGSQFGTVDYGVEPNRSELENILAQHIREDAVKVVKKVQTELKGDAFKLGNHGVRKNFNTWEEWKEFDWDKKFRDAEVSVEVDVKLKWFGFQFAPPKVER